VHADDDTFDTLGYGSRSPKLHMEIPCTQSALLPGGVSQISSNFHVPWENTLMLPSVRQDVSNKSFPVPNGLSDDAAAAVAFDDEDLRRLEDLVDLGTVEWFVPPPRKERRVTVVV